MDIDSSFKTIQGLYKAITGKADGDVILTYKGTAYGVTKPWVAKIDSREASAATYDDALMTLLLSLKKELSDKIHSGEQETRRLKQALSQLDN